MNVLDLFSGIGGFSLGLERAGMRTVAFCEIDPYCRKVLRKHWPDVPIHEDVRRLDASAITNPVDLVCGGFPCQPFSLAGKRCGEADDRHLWPEMLRIVQVFQPSWVIGENVVGLISMGLDQVLSDLEGIGYACQAFVIPAVAVDASHRRDRVWVVAHTNGNRRQRAGEVWKGRPCTSRLCKAFPNADSAGWEKQHTSAIPENKGLGNWASSPRWCPWPVEPGVGRVVDGIPHRVDRLRALGNAVVPQVVEVIGRTIMEVEK